jgi:vancomycin permeability regulator SanA
MESQSKKIWIRRILVYFLIFTCAGIVAMYSINRYIEEFTKNKIISAEESFKLDADCILILGAGVYANGIPSAMLEDRLIKGIELYKSGTSDRLLMSGDHGRKDYDEVNVMKQYAIDKGVPSENIFMDHAGFSTYESLYRARDIFKVKKVIIVTQKYHLSRALYVAENLGLEAYGVASDPRQYAGQNYREIRETLARIKDFFYVIAKPKPTFLGEVIPVSGNGDLTND